jgi:tellurite methyltransferase
MNRSRLAKRDLLDPRPETETARQPIGGAVNIPFAELPDRLHELPPRSVCTQVAGPPDLAGSVVKWLEQRGRSARVAAAKMQTTPSAARSASGSTVNEIARLWEPSAFLEQVAARLRPGSTLDLACGSGRNAVFLACCGWSVRAIDVLPDALALGRDLERRYARGWPPISWVCADLEAAEWPGPGGRFDLITMLRYLDRPLLARLAEWLNPGASIVLETFTTLHRERHGRPARPAHVLRPGELKELLAPLSSRMLLHHYSEAWRSDEHTARLWAEWDGPSSV